MTTDKLTTATFTQERMGLVWIKTRDKDHLGGGDFSDEYTCWMLVERATDRMLVSIDEPYQDKICFIVACENGSGRRFISLDGAKRYAVGRAIEILTEERVDRCRNRKVRRLKEMVGQS